MFAYDAAMAFQIQFCLTITSILVLSLTCQLVLLSTRFCLLFSKFFNIVSTFLSTKCPPDRKKSILARVDFDAKGGYLQMLAK